MKIEFETITSNTYSYVYGKCTLAFIFLSSLSIHSKELPKLELGKKYKITIEEISS